MGSFCKIRRSKRAIQFIRHKLHIVFKLLNCHYLPYAYRDSVFFFAVPADSFFGTNQLYDDKLLEAVSVEQTSVFEAAERFARVEGILPAPESSHAIKVAIDEALKCKETGEEKTIVFGLTGTGYFDMVAYGKYNDGEMSDYIPTDEDLAVGFAGLPKVDK